MRALCVCISVASLASTVCAQQATVSLADLTEELVRNNPAIRAARSRYDAATKRAPQVSTPPEPKVSFTDFGVGHPFSRLGVSDFAYAGLGISQEIPFPGKLALAGEEARKDAAAEGQVYRAQILESTSRLKVAYYDWFYILKAIEIT